MRTEFIRAVPLSEIGRWCGALMRSADMPVKAIATHSAEVRPGDLFIALKGDNGNGEDYISEALERGGAVLAEGSHDASMTVDCTRTALLRIAEEYKRRILKPKYTVAITGSVGKTTTKELTAKILSSALSVHATEKNFNNELGVAYTVLSAPEKTEVLICELGMNHLGEIDRLTRALEPDIAVITNIGTAHIGNLGSKEMIAKAKSEICNSDRLKFLLAPYSEPLLSSLPSRITVSTEDLSADLTLLPEYISKNGSSFKFYLKGRQILSGKTELFGEHLLTALSYAISIGYILGIPPEKISYATSEIKADQLRQSYYKCGIYRILDDTYSSSPEAVMAMIDAMVIRGEKFSAVLGDMLELGASTEQLHRRVGAYAYKKGAERLYTYGPYGGFIAAGAIEAGMPKERIFKNSSYTEPGITAEQISKSYEGELLLFKGSHKVGMQKIINELSRL